MPFITKSTFIRLRSAGNHMSNLCFNLSQVRDNPKAQTMKECQVAWDAALAAIRDANPASAPQEKK